MQLLYTIAEAVQSSTYTFQDWLQDVSKYDEILKGFAIGVLVSAPMGPVGILTIQRTLNKGRWEGFATGIGAGISDLIYALITGYGMSFIVDIIEDRQVALILKLVGSLLLFIFGVYTFKSTPKSTSMRDNMPKVPKNTHKFKKLSGFAFSGFAVTVSNPLIVFLYAALYGQFTFILVDNPIPQTLGYVFILVGAITWWFVLTWLVNKARKHFNNNVIWWINRVIGIGVMVVSAIIIIITVTGHAIKIKEEHDKEEKEKCIYQNKSKQKTSQNTYSTCGKWKTQYVPTSWTLTD